MRERSISQVKRDLEKLRRRIKEVSSGDLRMVTSTLREVFDGAEVNEWNRLITRRALAMRAAATPGSPRLAPIGEDTPMRFLEGLALRLEERIDDLEADDPGASGLVSDEAALVFVGHGRNPLWNRVTRFLKDERQLPTEDWESYSRAGYGNVEVLKDLLARATFAVIVVTAEDVAADKKRARQNVVHEIGLFQGRLGFQKVALLIQDGVEEFSNIAGLQTIPFAGDNVTSAFYELGRMLDREGVTATKKKS